MGAAERNPNCLVAAWDVDAVGHEQQEMEEVAWLVDVSEVGFDEGELDSRDGAERGRGC